MTETVIADLAPGGAHRRARSRSTSATATPAGRRRSPTSSRPARRRSSSPPAASASAGRQTARQMGVDVEVMDFGFRAGARPRAASRTRLRADRGHAIRAVLAVQTDTASSVRNDVAGAARGARRRRASGAPRRRLHRLPRLRPLRDGRLGRRRDGRRLPEGADDPAGPRLHLPRAEGRGGAACAARAPTGTGGRARRPRSTTSCFCGTAPTHHLYGLRAALDMILDEEGLEAVWSRHARLRPRRLGGGRRLGRGRRARAQHRRPRARAATR